VATVLERVEQALLAAGVSGRSVLLAVSGGIDSTSLAHALGALREPLGFDLAIGHVNHGLRGAASDEDERAVAALAGELGVAFASERVEPAGLQRGEPSRTRPTIQEAARRLRREALSKMRTALGYEHIATGHNADDQAETVLMRLLRGCGPDSLGGISEASPDGILIRPLLGVSRTEIEVFARDRHLSWREDASNADLGYTRNRLRARVLPGLAEDFNPRLLRAIGDLAEAQRRDTEWLDALVREEAGRLFARDAAGGLRIAAGGWSDRREALARRLAKWALMEMGGGRELSRAHLMRVLAFLREGRPGTAIELPGGIRLRREKGDSFLLERASHRE
jgi:tRNA(Ile)-lysidine synthase